MINFKKNNLGGSSSPYLEQHKNNPVHWQEWGEEALDFAKKNNRLILVSIGYSTCHWCHVMASEAFSDPATADYLNNNFVSIKVDREQRPDIDDYFMNFVTQTNGRGGWPLNVVLSPEGKPIFGGTYFPHQAKHGLRSFAEVLQGVKAWYEKNKDLVRDYEPIRGPELPNEVEETALARDIHRAFDDVFGGFGTQTKFPPYSTLLLLLNFFQETKSSLAEQMILKTLDGIMNNGIHDHLQGGFYRYAVDREWTIPHFEKMLYDQAMHLWVFSLAYQIFKRGDHMAVVEKIVQCLQATFSDGDGLFYSAHDADTNHVEGATYIWSEEELKAALSPSEFSLLAEEYAITAAGNFEGKNHLVKNRRKNLADTPAVIEAKLLTIRKKRPQPFIDKKIITSWNALTGIGLLVASRYLVHGEYKKMAKDIFAGLIEIHSRKGAISHSSLGGILQNQEFLEDQAALFLFATYLYEDAEDDAEKTGYRKYLEVFLLGLNKFKVEKDGVTKWFTNKISGDFKQVPAQTFDHPTPSAVSLAEMALFRAKKFLRKEDVDVKYKALLENDFHNLAAWFSRGKFHDIESPEKIDWSKLPINSLFTKGTAYKDCTTFTCHEFKSEAELLDSLPAAK